MVAVLYPLYSHTHTSYSRTEHLLPALGVTNSTYHNILISDPSPVSLNFRNIQSRPEYNWSFNLLHLKDRPFIEHITTHYLVQMITGRFLFLGRPLKYVVMIGHCILFEADKPP